jgi:transketolase
MEGISHEASSLAGTLKLGKLVAFFDDNGITIDGDVHGWCTDDTPKRFEAYGWTVIRNVEGNDSEAVAAAVAQARAQSERPTLICCRTVIGFGSPHRAGTANGRSCSGSTRRRILRLPQSCRAACAASCPPTGCRCARIWRARRLP